MEFGALEAEDLAGNQKHIVQCEGLNLDTVSLRANLHGNDLQLTPKEFALLLYMVQNRDRIVSVAQIYQNVWNLSPNRDTRLLWTHFSKISNMLEKFGINPFDISAVKSKGYIHSPWLKNKQGAAVCRVFSCQSNEKEQNIDADMHMRRYCQLT